MVDHVTCIDQAGEVRLSASPSLAFDLLSGRRRIHHRRVRHSTQGRVWWPSPMQTFLTRLRDALTRARNSNRSLRVAIVGGGAAGVEIALCLPAFVRAAMSQGVTTLVSDGGALLPWLHRRSGSPGDDSARLRRNLAALWAHRLRR